MRKLILSEAAAMPYLLQYIEKWRQENERPTGAVVVYEGEIAGWMDSVRDPNHWCPGCLAFGSNGGIWRAVGGDDYNGARGWDVVRPVPDRPEEG